MTAFHLTTRYKLLLLTSIIILGAILRFYSLDWGQGLFTHPDEYHIVASVNQLSFPNQMHPHFFSYGTVTIYLVYFTQEIINYLSQIHNSEFIIHNSFLVGRFYSALFSTLTILVVYGISRIFLSKKFSLLAALLAALTPGLIQQAHFATPESALIFFLFGSLLFMLKSIKQNKIVYLTLASIFLGLALGVKISSIVFLLPLMAAIGIQFFRTALKTHYSSSEDPSDDGDESRSSHRNSSRLSLDKLGIARTISFSVTSKKNLVEKVLRLIEQTFVSLITVFATFVLAAPFVFIDYPAFRSNLQYEGALALGNIPVFYTRQFIDTVPIVFQLEKIFPYALGPAILVFGVLGFFLIVVKHLGWWHSKTHLRGVTSSHLGGGRLARRSLGEVGMDSSEVKLRSEQFILTIAFLSLFLPSAFLFAKWTRFIAPTFPFFAVFAVFFLERFEKNRFIFYFLSVTLLVGTALWTTAFFSIYTSPDIRITASRWLESNVKGGSVFLVEGGNMVDLPLSGNYPKISLNFYNLEEDPLVRGQIADALYTSDYFLVQSRRVFMNHQRLPDLYPKTIKFYDSLFNGELGFEQIKEFHSYPRLQVTGYRLQVPDEGAEETWSVFDHPVIRVFKKNASFTREDYARFLEL